MRHISVRWLTVLSVSWVVGCSTKPSGEVGDGGTSAITPWDTAGEDTSEVATCRSHADCDTGQYCTNDGVCAPGCRTSEECIAVHGGGAAVRCDPVTHQCSGCTADVDCPAGYLCTAGALCTPGCTETHRCPDGGSCCSGRCVDLAEDLANCGACGVVCAPPHGTGDCNGGVCEVVTCTTGWDDCDGQAANGCEVFLATDVLHCGACNEPCVLPNARPSCVAGACAIAACEPGFHDCDLDPWTGCEDDLKSLENCGACGVECYPDGATGTCATGTCAIASCGASYADCDGVGTNGCEVELLTDEENCGTCGNVCASGVCTAGVCAPDTAPASTP